MDNIRSVQSLLISYLHNIILDIVGIVIGVQQCGQF